MTIDFTQQFNPFPGLRPFNVEEDFLFFGREEQITELLGLLRKHRFLAVVGTSGSGKSSLVRAGLLPALHGGTMTDAGSQWKVILLRPGGDPMTNLARAIIDEDLYDSEDAESLPRVKATLTRSRAGLIEAVRQSNIEPETNLLIVVDQFEELFRFSQTGITEQEGASAFVKLLLAASRQTDYPLYVAITMRSDYLGECAVVPGLAEAVNDGEYLIPRLNRQQRRDAIEMPISVGGGQISTRLVHKLLNAVGDDADQLPVLQHALMRIWDFWTTDHAEDEPLDLLHYERAGGLDSALSLHADEVYAALPDDRHRLTAEKLFKALTEQGADNRGIRKPTRFDQLCSIADATPEHLTAVIEAFRGAGRTFLMPMQDVPLTPEAVIDISHESLMRVWGRLEDWVAEESQSARIYRRLADTAALYREGRAGVYRNPDLQIALSWRETSHPNQPWAERYHLDFEQAMKFLEASSEADSQAEEAREAARKHELEQAKKLAETERLRAQEQQRSAKRLQRLVGVLSVATVLAFAACCFAFFASNQASQQSRSAQLAHDSALARLNQAIAAETAADEARGEAEIARDEAEIRAYTAGLAAAAADLKRNDVRTLKRRLEEAPKHLRGWEWAYLWNESDRSLETTIELPPENEGYYMSFSLDGQLVATRPAGGHDKPVTVYDTRSGEEVATLETISSSNAMMTFSADKRLLAYRHWGTPGVQIYDIATAQTIIPARMQRSFNSFLAFDPDGARAVVLTNDGKLRIFKTEDWSQTTVLSGVCALDGAGRGRRGAISPDGKLLVVGANDEDPMRVYDLESNEIVQEIPESTIAIAVRFNGSGTGVTTVATDGTIIKYAVSGWRKVSESREHRQQRGDVAVHRLDGRSLTLSFDPNGSVAMFDSNLIRKATLRGHRSPGASIAVDEELEQVVTAHDDGVVRRWDLRFPKNLRLSPQEVAFTPDGQTIYAGISSDSGNGAQQVCGVDVTSSEILGYLRWFPTTLMHGSMATQVAYSPDGLRVAVSTSSGWGQGRWRIYNLWTGVAEHEENVPWNGDLLCIDWSADGRWIAVGGDMYFEDAGRVRVYDAETYQQVAQLDGHAEAVNDLTFSPDDQRLITASEDGTLCTWEVPGGKLLSTIGQQGGSAFNCLINEPDGGFVVAGSADGTVSVWNALDGEELFRAQVHGAAVNCLAFTPDGSRLVSAAADRSLKIFDPKSWRELLTLHLEESARAMSFSPDGKRLALATSSLIFLDTEMESVRFQERQLARDRNKLAKPLVKDLLQKTSDPLPARDQIVSNVTLDDETRSAALRELRVALDRRWRKSYEVEDLTAIVVPNLARQILGQQLSTSVSLRRRVDHLVSSIDTLPDLEPLQHQALVEFATAYLRAGRADTNGLAWELVLPPGRSPEDYLLAYFGMSAAVRRNPENGAYLNTMATAEYRVGLFRDAQASAEHSERLYQSAGGPLPHNLVVIAMSQHRMGQANEAADSMQQIDELMKLPQWSTDEEAIALVKETKQVLASPVDIPWDESAAWESCKQRLEELSLDVANRATWQVVIAKRLADRKFSDQSTAWLVDAVDMFHKVVKSDPKSDLAQRQLGWALAAQGNHDEATDAFRRAVELDTKDANNYLSLANSLRQAKQLDEAVSILTKSLEINAEHVASLVALGRLQRELGQLEESRDTLKQALKLEKDSQQVQNELQKTEEALSPQPKDKSAEDKSAEDKDAEDKDAEDKSAEDKKAEDKGAEDNTKEDDKPDGEASDELPRTP